jgi:hypothetical protein
MEPSSIETISRRLWRLAWSAAGGVVFAGLLPGLHAAASLEGVTAVASKVSEGYARERLPDGSVRPESYAFGEGGKWQGELSDLSIDKLHFIDVAKVIAAPLASQRYFPARNPADTKLLIMVYWGTTAVPPPTSSSIAYSHLSDIQNRIAQSQGLARSKASVANAAAGNRGYHPTDGNAGASDAQLDELSAALTVLNIENRQRDRTDFNNALMLGYDSPGLIGTERGAYVRGTALSVDRDDLYAEIEENRYFVVLMAYDFQLMWKEKKHRLLWETRFSISERHNQFDQALPLMASYASQYFGQASNGLVRTRVPEGNVEVENPTLIELISDPKK